MARKKTPPATKKFREWFDGDAMSGLGKFRRRDHRWSMADLNRRFDSIYLDPRFNRRGGFKNGGGWNIDQSAKYVRNFLDGVIFNRLLFVDPSECLRNCKSQNSIEYYTDIVENKRAKLITIDGFNSLSALHGAYLGELKIDMSEKKDGSEIGTLESSLEDDQFNLVTSSCRIEIATLENVEVDDLTQLFRDLNSGLPLNNQQFCQAMITPLADWIRTYGEKL